MAMRLENDTIADADFAIYVTVGFSQTLGYRKPFAFPMIRSFFSALALAHLLLASSNVAAAQFYKCNVNGAVQYQQVPCQSNEAKKPLTVEELKPERQKQLAKDRELPTSSKLQARPLASTAVLEEVPAKIPSSPRPSFKCDNRKYCTQMTSCAEAKYFLSNCPSVKMDGDRDGIPCEEQLCGH
jgi:hypothetical protein